MKYHKSLNESLHNSMQNDEKIILLGEDIIDPNGGAFKISQGLSTRFPDRVLTTPISESSLVGIGCGLALRGFRAIIEIMFGDFITLTVDQIINHAVKFENMYNKKVKVPIVIRTPVGGGRGYGPTHSQSLEKIFLGIPGLKIIAPSHFHDPGLLLKNAIYEDSPVLFIENKLLYPMSLYDSEKLKCDTNKDEKYSAAIVRNYSIETEKPDILIITYGGVSKIIEELFVEMREEEIWCAAVIPSDISEPPYEIIYREAANAGRVIIVEEGYKRFNWGSEISSKIYENIFPALKSKIRLLAAESQVIPACYELEQEIIINKLKIENTIMEAINGN